MEQNNDNKAESYITIQEIIEENKQDKDEIIVVIQDSGIKTSLGDDEEIYFGKLSGIPASLYCREVIKISIVCTSSDIKRIGANLLIIQ